MDNSVHFTEDELRFSEPATYEVVVRGHLQVTRADLLGAFCITTESSDEHVTKSVLTGTVRDQAELAGLLNNLYELHLPIMEVKWIRSPKKLNT